MMRNQQIIPLPQREKAVASERLFLPRKPGVYAYAARAPIRISSIFETQPLSVAVPLW